MTCSDFLDRYSDYDDSLLTPAEQARFAAHLDACDACARYDRVLRKGRMVARQLGARPSRDFMPRLEERILTAPNPRTAPGPMAAGGFVTLAMAAVVGLWMVDGSAGGPAGEVLQPGSRAVTLPVSAQLGPADWTAGGVDRRTASSYSPVVIGPPAYRAARSLSTSMGSATSHTLD